MKVEKNVSKNMKIIKYIYFIVLLIAIAWAHWHYQIVYNLIVDHSSYVTIDEVKVWRVRSKILDELGLISIFVNYLSMRKRSGSRFTTMVVNYLSIKKNRSIVGEPGQADHSNNE